MIRVKRTYRAWVANETLEDYSLRYAAQSYRKWSPYLLANTALGGISFLALEAAIMAQAVELYFGVPLVIGYVVCSLVIIPITFFGVTLINRLQLWTQPLWAVLLVMPFFFILAQEPEMLAEWSEFAGRTERGASFDFLFFGAATGVLFSLVVQVGEQVDYLRFLPDCTPRNRWRWWISLISAGPGWILIGGAKILAGGLLAYIVLRDGAPLENAVEPIHMYVKAYGFVFDDAGIVILAATVFVIVSQVKINVTNAYAGSLAWGNSASTQREERRRASSGEEGVSRSFCRRSCSSAPTRYRWAQSWPIASVDDRALTGESPRVAVPL